MSKQLSFSAYEKEYMPIFRKMINTAEDKIDVENHFSRIVSGMFKKIFDGKELPINDDDIQFSASDPDNFIISKNLKNSGVFLDTWNNSDLPNLVKKFAGFARNHFLHLDKHPEKTEKKIRN